MKKVFCVLLAFLLMMSMVACGQSANSPTEVPNKEPEATTSPVMDDAEVNETTVYESAFFDNLMDYEAKIHELGFNEFKIDIYRPSYDSGPACVPSKLDFNQNEFKLYFDYYVLNYETNELELIQGWTLYGRSNQTAATNFSDYKETDYEDVDICENKDMSSDFVHQVEYSMYNLKDGIPESLVSCTALYYPSSNNAYNLVYEYEDALNINGVRPTILASNADDMAMESMGDFDDSYRPTAEPETDTAELLVMKIQRGDDIVEYYYEAGMTLTDWAKTDYNVDHWMIYNDGGCYASDYEYYISPNNIAIEEIPTVDGVIHATPGQE